MIRDVDESLLSWLGALLPEVTVSFQPPGSGPPARAKAAVLRVFLSEIREESDATHSGWVSLRNDEGVVVGRLPASRRYRFSYLLMVEAEDTLTEHEVLGRLLSGTALGPIVPREHVADALTHTEDPIIVRCAPAKDYTDPTHLWQAWGVVPRTSLDLTLLASLPTAAVDEVATPPGHIDLSTRRASPETSWDGTPAAAPARRRPSARIEEG